MSTDDLTATFTELFGSAPEGTWSAPGRVNLIGEHTDYNAGFALPFAIDRAATVRVVRTAGRTVRLASTFDDAAPIAVSLDALSPDTVAGWARYPAGVIWGFERRGHRVPGFDLLLDSAVPVGAGLSSSAAVECAVAVAVNDLLGSPLDRAELVQLTHEAENDFVGAPTGILDQSASLLSEAGHALFLDCRSRETAAVPLDLAAAGLSILVIDTRVSHAHDTGGYRDRVASCQLGARLLGVATLREITPEIFAGAADLLDDVTYRRVRHIWTENERVLETVAVLREAGPAAIGDLLTASHRSMRDDFEISAPELDVAVDAAIAAGALGARMTGGGFGGSAIALVPAADSARIGAAVTAAFADQGFTAPDLFEVTPGPGARQL